MNNGLSGIKNVIWALGIVVALAAVLIGLIVTMVTRFNGTRQDGTMNLGGTQDKLEDEFLSKPSVDAGQDTITVNELPSSQDTGLEYLFNLTFLCDSSLTEVSSFGANFGSTASSQVWLPASGSFPAANAASTKIIYPQDGSEKTAADAAKLYQPSRLVIYLGADSLANTTAESFIAGYTALVQSIQSESPETTIICCSLASVSASYGGSDGLTSELITQANQWIQQVCANTGVYYADLASVLNDSGQLAEDYASADGRTINSTGISKIMEYFRMHGV